jgi:hypothetical protein
MKHEIGATVIIKTIDGEFLTATVEGRNWCFDRLLSYSVKAEDGKRYNVDADTMEAGHSHG